MGDETPRTVNLGAPGPDDPVEVLPPGSVVGAFKITANLAAGGGGRVYAAEHRVLSRRAAVKVLHRHLAVQPEMVERFVREAKAVNRIAHPNIVDIYELGVLDDGRPYYVMELIDGSDLATEIRRRGRVSPHDALTWLTPLCDALHAAHQAGVVHRDLKASNVLIGTRDGRQVIKLHDFGIAKLIDPVAGEAPLTTLGRRLGTPYAMAPEQIRGEAVDHRADIYAMGVLVFQLLTGTYPFVAEDPTELDAMHLTQPPPRPISRAPVAPALEAVVLRCLAKRAADRFPDVPSLLSAYRTALSDEVGAGPTLGLAIHVEAPLDADTSPEAADLVGDALDRIESLLAAAGYTLPLQLAGALLAVRTIPDVSPSPDVGAALGDADAVLRIAGEDAPRWTVVVHVDRFQLRAGKPFSGPLLQISSWVTGVSPGVTLTQAARGRLAPTG